MDGDSLMGTSKYSDSEPDRNEFSSFQLSKTTSMAINRGSLMVDRGGDIANAKCR